MTEPERESTRLAPALAVLGVLLGTTVLAFRRLDDWDLPWNLATGRIIATTHAIPRVDDLAFTHGTLRYTEVVADLLLYAVIHAFGPLGLQVLGALVAAGTLIVVHRAMHRHGPIAYAIAAVIAASIYPWLYVRPQSMSFLLLSLVILAIERARSEPSSKALWAIAPLQLVWANVHGYAPLGAILLAAWTGQCLLDRKRPVPWAPTLLAIAATCVSTAGPRLLVMVKRFDEDLAGITEWLAPTPGIVWQTSPVFFLVLLLVVAALFLGREPDGRRAPPIYDLVVLALATLLLVRAIRFVPVFALLTAPLVARRLGPFVRPTRVMQLACAFTTVLPTFAFFVGLEDLLGVGWQPGWFPEKAADWIEQKQPKGNMWNFMPFGGYLAWRLHPRFRVFNDGRNALARDVSLVTRARESMSDAATFTTLTRELDQQWAITCTIGSFCPPSARFNEPLTTLREWRMVYFDEVAAIYVRADGPNAPMVKDGYFVLHHLTTAPDFLATARGKTLPPQLLQHDGQLAIAQAPNSVRAQTLAAIGALAVRDRPAFDAALGRIAQLAPQSDAIPTLQAAWGQP